MRTVTQWRQVKIKDLGKVITGRTPSTKDEANYGGNTPFVTPTELGNNKPIDFAERTLSEQGCNQANLLPEGAVLVCCIGSLGKVGIAGCEVATNQQINAVVFDEKKIDARYGLYACKRLDRVLNQIAPATTVSIVNKSRFSNLEIPVPPLEEQRRIAEILDLADGLRVKRREALAEVEGLTEAVFLEMFGLGDWPEVHLTEASKEKDDIKCGPFGTQLHRSEFQESGVPLWGIKQVNAKFKLSTHEFVTLQKANELSSYSIFPGDIVMTRKGTVGNCAVYPTSFQEGIMHSDLLRIRVDFSRFSPIFVSSQLQFSRRIEHQIELISGGAIMKGINVTKLKKILIESPPLPLQQKFAERVEAIEKLKASHQRSLEEMDALFASLQSRAFKGEL